MDQTSFEQISIAKSLIGNKSKLLKENIEVNVQFHDDNPISIGLPSSIECKVITTEISIKGQTVSSSYKPAILDNGMDIMVPPFINQEDKILLNTDTLEYI